MRTITVDDTKDDVAFVEVVKPMEGKDVIFLAQIDTLRWILEQMKMIDKPEMVADINFTQEEIHAGLFLPTEIRVMIETKETKKKVVPNPRGNIPMSSSFGYIDLTFTNYRVNTMVQEEAKEDSLYMDSALLDSLNAVLDSLK